MVTKATRAMTMTPSEIPAHLTLSHWLRPESLLRLDGALQVRPDQLAQRMPLGDMGEVEDEIVTYSGIFATEDRWMLRLYARNFETGRYEPRWMAFRLKLTPRTVAADLGTPAGVPAMWNHMTWASGAMGRVQTAEARDGRLTGTFSLSSFALAGWGASFSQLDAGLNTGLSVGVKLIDEPTYKRAKGDDGGKWDSPDEVTYGRIALKELSLTATPMIHTAGITGRKESENA